MRTCVRRRPRTAPAPRRAKDRVVGGVVFVTLLALGAAVLVSAKRRDDLRWRLEEERVRVRLEQDMSPAERQARRIAREEAEAVLRGH